MHYDPQRLKFHMERRIQTTMIGAIARMEENFGYLWGHDKDGPLSPEEEKFADIWDFTRNEILNYGNKQIRNLDNDFNRYGGIFKSNYHYTFKVAKKDNNNTKE